VRSSYGLPRQRGALKTTSARACLASSCSCVRCCGRCGHHNCCSSNCREVCTTQQLRRALTGAWHLQCAWQRLRQLQSWWARRQVACTQWARRRRGGQPRAPRSSAARVDTGGRYEAWRVAGLTQATCARRACPDFNVSDGVQCSNMMQPACAQHCSTRPLQSKQSQCKRSCILGDDCKTSWSLHLITVRHDFARLGPGEDGCTAARTRTAAHAARSVHFTYTIVNV
jgi:hypothetical protein